MRSPDAAGASDPPQPWCADPSTDPPDAYGDRHTTKGYETKFTFGVNDFAVTGGFEYKS